tara:strand:+ start:2924 stop:3328 length:405 start_codon:yes stop_codon:yes gene_type:complete
MKPKVLNWIKQLQNGEIDKKTIRILNEIHRHTNSKTGKGFTHISELRTDLQIAHQSLTAVLSHVQDEGMIDMYGEILVGDSLFQKIRYAREHEREGLILKRKQEKYNKWLRIGVEELSELMPYALLQELQKERQ